MTTVLTTQLSLTIKQTGERPMHLPRCSIRLEGDHFEFVAHHTAAGSNDDDDDDRVNSKSHHVGTFRPLQPPATKTFVVRVFYRDIAKMEAVPEIAQIIVTTQSPTQSAFIGPAAPFMAEHAVAAQQQQRNAMLPKFPGAPPSSSSSSVAGEDDYHESYNGSRGGTPTAAAAPAFEDGVVGAKSRSPPPRPTAVVSHHFAVPTAAVQTGAAGRADDGRVTPLGHHAAQRKQQQQQQQMQQQPPAPTVGHTRIGGIRRQYILLLGKEHIAAVWYRAMTEAVESWTELLADGKRNALRLAAVLKRHNDGNLGDENELLEETGTGGDTTGQPQRRRGAGESSPLSTARRRAAARKTVLSDEDEELFVQQDILDVEEAISTLQHEYHRDGLGWGARRVNFDSELSRSATLRRGNPFGGKTLQGSRFLGGYKAPRDAAEEEAQRRQRVEQTRRVLVPMWEDVAALRDSIVNKIANNGALDLAHETPPRNCRPANGGRKTDNSNEERRGTDPEIKNEQEAPVPIDGDASPQRGAADAYEASPPRPLLSTRQPLLSTTNSFLDQQQPAAAAVPAINTFVGNVAAASAPPPAPTPLLQPAFAPAAPRKAPPLPPNGSRGLLLVPGRDVATRLSSAPPPPPPPPPPVRGGLNGALPTRSVTPPPQHAQETPLLSTTLLPADSTAVMPPARASTVRA